MTPTDRVASDRVREARVGYVAASGGLLELWLSDKGRGYSLAERLSILRDAIVQETRAECGADTARVVQIINSLDNVKPDGDAVSRYELLQAIEEAIRDD